MPITRRRVVCTLGETIETLVPTSRLSSVDLPTLGAPTIATKPARVGAGSAMSALARSAAASARRPPARPPAWWRPAAGCGGWSARLTSTVKVMAWAGPDGRDDPIDRALQAARLRPLLQHHLGIARRRLHGLDHGRQCRAHERPRRREAAVEIDGADQRLAAVGQQRRPRPRRRRRLARRHLQPAAEVERGADLGQALLAHQRDRPLRQRAFGVGREAARSAGGPRPSPSTRSPRNSSRW